MSSVTWGKLALLGLVFYALTQGGLFISLKYLESVTFSLMLNFSSVLVAIAGMVTLREYPSRWQWLGILVFSVGVLAYFQSAATHQFSAIGLVVAGMTL